MRTWDLTQRSGVPGPATASKRTPTPDERCLRTWSLSALRLAPGNRELGKCLALFDRYGEAKDHVRGSGNLQRFFEKSHNRESHDTVLLFKSCVSDHCFAMSLQLYLNRNALKVGCVNGGDSFDDEFRGTKFHKSLVDSTKLPFDYRFLAGAGLDLVNRFLDGGSFNPHHAYAPRRQFLLPVPLSTLLYFCGCQIQPCRKQN